MSSDKTEWVDLDWQAYQKLVAGLHADETTRVETEYKYPMHGAGTKNIDVVVWDNSDQYEYTVLIECKFKDRALPQSAVDDVNGYFQISDADKAVIVSKSGFQRGAIERARGTGVELLTLRQLIPGTDLSVDIVRYAEINLNITDRDLEVTEMDLEGLEDDEGTEREEVEHSFTPVNSHLYTTEREPLGETLLDRMTELKRSKEMGKHMEEFENIALLIRGDFFQLHSVDYVISESTAQREFTIDLLDDIDLLYRNEITGNEKYKSLSEALEAFRAHVEENS